LGWCASRCPENEGTGFGFAMRASIAGSGVGIVALLLVACGTVRVEGRLIRPAEATATAQAAQSALQGLGRLAYIQDGDLWIKDLPDGPVRRLTWDGQAGTPRWSPSGRWIAFRRGGESVWVMRADGEEAYPLNGGAPVGAFAWAPKSDQLAYVTADGTLQVLDFYEMRPLRRVLVRVPGDQIPRLAWSPYGTRIAYERRGKAPDGSPIGELWLVPAEGGMPVKVYPRPSEGFGAPILHGWTGDGRYLLVQGEMGSPLLLAEGAPLFALSVDGHLSMIVADSVLIYADFVAPQPGITSQIAVVTGGGRETWWNKRLRLIQLDSLVQSFVSGLNQAAASPAWSPDGRFIAYVAMPAVEGMPAGGEQLRQMLMQRRLWVMEVETGKRRRLTDDPAYRDERPLWSADGRYLLFVRMDAQNRVSLWQIPVEGGAPSMVVDALTPAPDWFGSYGHANWDELFDWWRGRP